MELIKSLLKKLGFIKEKSTVESKSEVKVEVMPEVSKTTPVVETVTEKVAAEPQTKVSKPEPKAVKPVSKTQVSKTKPVSKAKPVNKPSTKGKKLN